jgi:transcription elongation factor GreA
MADKILVTQEWLLKLQEELKSLKEVKRIEIAEKLKEAISFWDLSENSEYEDARNEQAAVEKRISDLESDLKNIEIIKDDNKSKDKVTIWSIVEIEGVISKEKEKFKIVGSTEADILAELPRISNESAVWKAILWKKKSDIIKVVSDAWKLEYKIISLEK